MLLDSPALASMIERMAPDKFKQLVQTKGWTYRALAERWHVTPDWVSEISRNLRRPPHYDDAVLGLPDRTRRQRKEPARKASVSRKRTRPRRPLPGYRYQGIIKIGELLSATDEIGSMADMGERGIVVQLIDSGIDERYRVVFQRGDVECFTADLIDQYLVTTGLSDEANTSYEYHSDNDLSAAYRAGKFDFRIG